MNTTTAFLHEAGLNRKRQPWLVYPAFIWIASAFLFNLGHGGEGLDFKPEGKGLMGFNTSVPTADNTELKRPGFDHPAYGSPSEGQRLSNFTNTQKGPTANPLQAFPKEGEASPAAANTPPAHTAPNSMVSTSPYRANPSVTKAGRTRRGSGRSNYQYVPAQPHYGNRQPTDNGLEPQLSAYQSTRQAGQRALETGQMLEATDSQLRNSNQTAKATGSQPHNFIQLDNPATASRLNEDAPSPLVESSFNTAPVGSNCQQGVATSLSRWGEGKRGVTSLIPAVIHDDQSVKAGQPVKIRLTKAVAIDGVRVPANTIVHATCRPDGDRLRLVVQNLQLGGQLIPLNLEAVDVDGGDGVNAPGLSDGLRGQIKSSAVQGVNIPTHSMLVNTVLNAARFGASSQVRQNQIHLKGGYQLYLKSI